jgi:hypothetical protein
MGLKSRRKAQTIRSLSQRKTRTGWKRNWKKGLQTCGAGRKSRKMPASVVGDQLEEIPDEYLP